MVAAAIGVGGGGSVRARGAEREGEQEKGMSEGVQGFEAAPKRRPEASRWRGTQAGREVAWRARRRRGVPPLPTGTRRKATGRRRWAGLLEELG